MMSYKIEWEGKLARERVFIHTGNFYPECYFPVQFLSHHRFMPIPLHLFLDQWVDSQEPISSCG